MNKQTKEEPNSSMRESGKPGVGLGRSDEVGRSGVYPVSEMEGAAPDAKVRGEKSFGQGERGAEGYEDSGTSEIFYVEGEETGRKNNAGQ